MISIQDGMGKGLAREVFRFGPIFTRRVGERPHVHVSLVSWPCPPCAPVNPLLHRGGIYLFYHVGLRCSNFRGLFFNDTGLFNGPRLFHHRGILLLHCIRLLFTIR